MVSAVVGFAVWWSLFQATTVVVTARGLDMTFTQSLIIALVSGALGAFGVIGGAWIASRATRPVKDRLEDVAGRVGASRRETDPGDD